MTPLILRPEPQASELASQLRAVGHTPQLCPLLTIVPGRELALLPEALSNHDRLIAISAHAVEQATLWLSQHAQRWPQLPTFAVGSATAASWQACDVAACTPQDARSEGLLALPELAALQGLRVLILRGDGGREFLAEQLRARGARVTYCECYQRQWPELDGAKLCTQWRTAGVDSVIISSGEILRRFLQLLPAHQHDWLRSLQIIVPSHRVATLVAEAGLPDATVAQGATHAAMVAALGKRN
jgi:uroporphyrinogen-III synthase